MTTYDLLIDLQVCHRSLVKQIPSKDQDIQRGVGSTATQSTPYAVLRRIFKGIKLTANDSFIDVGCGKGRVLAFLVRMKAPCDLWGVEMNEEAGRIATEWSKQYCNVHVIVGDAFELNYDQYTVLYMSRPFLPVTFLSFIELLESQLTHPITLLYWVDQQSGYLLRDRSGWSKLRGGSLYKVHGLKVASGPQGYSLWQYVPQR